MVGWFGAVGWFKGNRRRRRGEVAKGKRQWLTHMHQAPTLHFGFLCARCALLRVRNLHSQPQTRQFVKTSRILSFAEKSRQRQQFFPTHSGTKKAERQKSKASKHSTTGKAKGQGFVEGNVPFFLFCFDKLPPSTTHHSAQGVCACVCACVCVHVCVHVCVCVAPFLALFVLVCFSCVIPHVNACVCVCVRSAPPPSFFFFGLVLGPSQRAQLTTSVCFWCELVLSACWNLLMIPSDPARHKHAQ